MAYSIKLVNTWGEDTNLDVNIGGMGRIKELSRVLEIFLNEVNPSGGNDGNVLMLHRVRDNKEQILDEARAIKDINDVWVKQWLLDLVLLADEHVDNDNMGIAIW